MVFTPRYGVWIVLWFVFFAICSSCACIKKPSTATSKEFARTSLPVEVLFSPSGGCEQAILSLINSASSSVYVQAYSFTSKPIVEALSKAKARGLHVEVILDRMHSKNQELPKILSAAGISVFLDMKHAIAHNKIMVFDGQVVETGSFNFTFSAEHKNAENVLIIRDRNITDLYTSNWLLHASHSVLFIPTKESKARKVKPLPDNEEAVGAQQ